MSYSPQIYDIGTALSTASTVLMYTSIVTFALSLIKSKVLGFQMIIQIQMVYYSLVSISNPNPPFEGLISMKFIGGFYTQPANVVIQSIPQIFSSLGFYSNFWANFNIMLASFLLCPLLACVFFLISKFTKTIMMNKRLIGYGKECASELVLCMCGFNATKITMSWLINIQYQNSQGGPIAFGVIMMIVIMLQLFVFSIAKKHYKEFREQFFFKLSSKVYIYLLFLKVFISSLFFSFENKIQCSIYIAIILQVLFLVYVGLVRPHIHFLNYLKQLLSLSLATVCLCLNAYCFQTKKTTSALPSIGLYIPIIILSILFLIVLFSLIMICKDLQQHYVSNWIEKILQKKIENAIQQQPVGIQEGIGNIAANQEMEMMQTMLKHNRDNEKRLRINLSNVIERQDSNPESLKKKLMTLNVDFQ